MKIVSQNQKVVDLHPSEDKRSSVQEELEALNLELQQIMIYIGKIEEYNDLVNSFEVDSIRRSINTAAQRSYRAEQCARGLKVWKAT